MERNQPTVEGGQAAEEGSYRLPDGRAFDAHDFRGNTGDRVATGTRTVESSGLEDYPFVRELTAKIEIYSKEELDEAAAENFADRILAGETGLHLPILVYDIE